MTSKKPDKSEKETSSDPLSQERENAEDFIKGLLAGIPQKSAQGLIQWMPLGGSCVTFISALFKQEWFIAVLSFPVMIVTVIWAKYTESFLKRLGEVFEEKGRQDVDNLMSWQQQMGKAFTETIRWQLAGTDDKYLKCQGFICQDYETEGQFLETFIPQLNEVFVPLELSDLSISRSRGKSIPMPPGFQWGERISDLLHQSEGISIWYLLKNSQKIHPYRHLVLLAWGGYGKTTLLRHVTYIYTQKKQARGVPKLLPVFLKLREWQEKIAHEKPDLSKLIEKYHIPSLSKKTFPLPPNWAKNNLYDDKMLILLDGFDEVRPQWRKPVSDWIYSQMETYRESRFILTSRPGGYKDFPPEKQRFTAKLFIKNFNLGQQKEFLERWYLCQERYARGGKITEAIKSIAHHRTSNLVEQLSEKQELADLAKNPLMLNMIANLHRCYLGEKLPSRRTELYQDILQLQLWDRPRIKKIEMLLPLSKSQQALQGLALSMVQQNIPQLEYQQLIKTITPYLAQVDDSVNSTEFIKQIEQVSELLVKKDDYYEFAHLSFQGYLAAAEIKRTHAEDLLLQHWQDAWWKETTLLYVPQLRNPSPFIRRLIQFEKPQATSLAYECLKETSRQLDPDVKAELETVSSTVQDARYQKLEQLLKNQQFKDADKETYRLMIETVGKEEGQYFDPEDFDTFPCDDLRTLDQLWIKYSNGKFGFSVQKKIYMDELGGTRDYNRKIWYEFCDRVGWRKGEDSVVSYSDLTWELQAETPVGHLPFGGRVLPAVGGELSRERRSLLYRTVNCNISPRPSVRQK